MQCDVSGRLGGCVMCDARCVDALHTLRNPHNVICAREQYFAAAAAAAPTQSNYCRFIYILIFGVQMWVTRAHNTLTHSQHVL